MEMQIPSVSKKQARMMAAVAHNPEFAAKVGIPQSVGKEFNEADAGTGILRGKKKKKSGLLKKAIHSRSHHRAHR